MILHAHCYFCGPVDVVIACLTYPERQRARHNHLRAPTHKGMVSLAAELDAAIFVPPDPEEIP